MFSAHGVSKAVRGEAAERGFQVFDATCPLVTKVHVEVAKLARRLRVHHDRPQGASRGRRHDGAVREGIHLVEAVADVAHVRPRGDKLAVVTQTTLRVDDAAEILAAVKRRFPHVREPKKQDICYATQNRQDAVKVLAPEVDLVIVVGSPTSCNSNRLRELAPAAGHAGPHGRCRHRPAAAWFEGRRRVGLTAGASAPDILVQQVIERLRDLGAVSMRRLAGVTEEVQFPLPLGLGDRSMGELTRPPPGRTSI